jgi:hypothetical protein
MSLLFNEELCSPDYIQRDRNFLSVNTVPLQKMFFNRWAKLNCNMIRMLGTGKVWMQTIMDEARFVTNE